MADITVGVIGCGIGQLHVEGFVADPRVHLAAIAGLDVDRCKRVQSKHAIPTRYEDYQEMLADPSIDMVSVGVPNHLHKEVTIAALKAGKHVLVEKPLAQNSADGEAMVAAAQQSGKQLGIIFNRRGRHDVQIVRDLVQRGEFGEIYHAKAYWMRRSGIPGLGTWFTNKQLAGGGPLIDLGVHVIDMALWMMGDPRVVAVSAATYAALGPQGKGQWLGRRDATNDYAYEVEDFATALLRFENGSTLQLDTSWAGYTRHNDEFGASLMGTNGGADIVVKDYAETGTLTLFGDVAGVPAVTTPTLIARHGHGEIGRMFVDAILAGVPFSPSGEEGLQRVRLIEAIYASAELGREIAIS